MSAACTRPPYGFPPPTRPLSRSSWLHDDRGALSLQPDGVAGCADAGQLVPEGQRAERDAQRQPLAEQQPAGLVEADRPGIDPARADPEGLVHDRQGYCRIDRDLTTKHV